MEGLSGDIGITSENTSSETKHAYQTRHGHDHIPVTIPVLGAFLLLLASLIFGKQRRDEKYQYEYVPEQDTGSDTVRQVPVPFFYIPPAAAKDSHPPFRDLHQILEDYKNNMDMIVASVSLSQEIARRSEWEVFPDTEFDHQGRLINSDNDGVLFSSKLEERIKKTAEALESNYFVLESLLQPFPFTLALPSPHKSGSGSSKWKTFQNESSEKASAYDSAMQMITHIVRDWSVEGRRSRDSLYHWCFVQLIKYSAKDAPVLVPGSGLARLAHDISLLGFHVEANELSICMSAVAYNFLNRGMDQGAIFPFVFDFLINEVNSTDRYQQFQFPDKKKDIFLQKLIGRYPAGSLSYTVGDFVEIYSQEGLKGGYGAVATCFFIDTASNIYEYILVIRNALKAGGVWINIGPLQWHQNAKLHPSADELKIIIESMGFQIKTWSVDTEAVNYRHDDGNEEVRHTKYEGYRPLRFVAMLRPCSKESVEQENAVYQKIMNMRRLLGQSNRAPKAKSKNDISHVTITELY